MMTRPISNAKTGETALPTTLFLSTPWGTREPSRQLLATDNDGKGRGGKNLASCSFLLRPASFPSGAWIDRPGMPQHSELAKIQTLFRMDRNPTAQAGITSAWQAYPRPSRSESTSSRPIVMCPATFSHSTQAGRTLSTTWRMTGQRWRSSAAPWRLPAREKGWQGYPPQTRSTAGKLAGSMARMSPRLGT